MDKVNVECEDDISVLLSGYVTIQSGMEWPGDIPEGPELQASGISYELDPKYFPKDTKDQLDPNSNRSVKVAKPAKARHSCVPLFSNINFTH